jgi:hypothetical protein
MDANNWMSKIVINIITKEEFTTIKDAAKSIGLAHCTLSNKLNGRRPNDTDLCFKLAI